MTDQPEQKTTGERTSWWCRTFGHAYENRAATVINTTRWAQPVEQPVTVLCRRCGDRP